MQHMVLTLSTRALGAQLVHSLSEKLHVVKMFVMNIICRLVPETSTD